MRKFPLILMLLALTLIWGCSHDQVAAPEASGSRTGPDGQFTNSGDVVTLADLQVGMGAGAKLAGADVAIIAFTASPANLLPGDTLTLQATVANLGAAPAQGPFDVWIGVLNTGFEFTRVSIDRLAPGESRSGVVNFTLPAAKLAAAYPPGAYTLYCTHNFGDSNPTNNYLLAEVTLVDVMAGDIQVTVTPAGLDAPWTLTGPAGYAESNSGSVLLTGLAPGDYSIAWGSVPGYVTPPPETATLTAGATLTFTGDYMPVSGEVLRMYFPDQTFCTTATFGSQVTAYIVYDNPTVDSVRGVECGFDLTTPAKDAQVSSFATITYPVDVVDVGINDPGAGTYNLIAGFGTLYPLPAGWDKVLATLTIFYLDPGELDITLRAADPESPPVNGEVKVVDEFYNIHSVPVGQAPGSPSLAINPVGPCPVVQSQ